MRILLLFFLVASCRDIASSESPHTAAVPIYEQAPFMWTEPPFVVVPSAGFQVGDWLADDHPVVVRLQGWAERVRAEVQKNVPTPLSIPRPIIKVVEAKVANAWVSAVPVCLSADVDLNEIGAPGRKPQDVALAFITDHDVMGAFSFGGAQPTCQEPTHGQSAADAIAFFNRYSSKCKIEVAQNGQAKVVGAGCIPMGKNVAPTRAKRLAYFATAPYIQVTSAMLANTQDERAIVAVLAHELGHFYRAHPFVAQTSNAYDYWYTQPDPPVAGKPTPSQDSDALVAALDRLMPYPRARVPGQALSYRLTAYLLSSDVDNAIAPVSACALASSRLAGDWTRFFGGFDDGTPPPAAAQAYREFEMALLDCASQVPATPKMLDAIDYMAPEVADPRIDDSTLGGVLAALQTRAAELDAQEAQLLQSIGERHLGKYTAEQEADDFSLEMFTRLGFSAKTYSDLTLALDGITAQAHPDDYADANGGIDFATCAALYDADFMRDGATVFVPLGSLHDRHHGACYRLFNIHQEQRAHGYTPATPATLAPGWDALNAEMRAMTDAYVPGPIFQ